MKLFLDDERSPNDVLRYISNHEYLDRENWVVVKNFEEFKNHISNEPMPKLISFDHDLYTEHYTYAVQKYIPYNEFEEKTGYHCLLWLILHCNKHRKQLPKILIHTMNKQGEDNMKALLGAYEALDSNKLP